MHRLKRQHTVFSPLQFFEIKMLDIILESLFWWSAIETELEIEEEDVDEEC